jgi:mannose-6-phosphate isomerase-like protein (cupin superfamily)
MISLVLFLVFFSAARQVSTSSGVVVTSAEMSDTLRNAKPNPGAIPGTTDVTVRSVDAGNANVGIALVQRVLAETNDAILHEKVTEIYYMTQGSGTLELGGTLVDPKPFGPSTGLPDIGPSQRGTGIRGGTSRRVGVGDVVVIPAGTPHRFTAIDGPITYITYRVDPSKVTPLK